MTNQDLYDVLVYLIEKFGGAVEITREEALKYDASGKVVVVAQNNANDSIVFSLEEEEDINAQYTEG